MESAQDKAPAVLEVGTTNPNATGGPKAFNALNGKGSGNKDAEGAASEGPAGHQSTDTGAHS